MNRWLRPCDTSSCLWPPLSLNRHLLGSSQWPDGQGGVLSDGSPWCTGSSWEQAEGMTAPMSSVPGRQRGREIIPADRAWVEQMVIAFLDWKTAGRINLHQWLFPSPYRLGDIWRCLETFWLSHLGGGSYWHPVGRGQPRTLLHIL